MSADLKRLLADQQRLAKLAAARGVSVAKLRRRLEVYVEAEAEMAAVARLAEVLDLRDGAAARLPRMARGVLDFVAQLEQMGDQPVTLWAQRALCTVAEALGPEVRSFAPERFEEAVDVFRRLALIDQVPTTAPAKAAPAKPAGTHKTPVGPAEGQIRECLSHGPLTKSELRERLPEMDPRAFGSTLSTMVRQHRARLMGERYELANGTAA